MEGLCRNCVSPIAPDEVRCRRCPPPAPSLAGVIALPIVVAGVLTLNVYLCIAGAAVGLAAIAWYGMRLLRDR